MYIYKLVFHGYTIPKKEFFFIKLHKKGKICKYILHPASTYFNIKPINLKINRR